MKIRGFEVVSDNYRKYISKDIKLPERSTLNSAGYDFFSPINTIIPAKEKVLIWSDIKAYMQPNEVLLLDVRSSIGIKRGLMLANTLGVVDADYFSNKDNDGNIGICLYNYTDKDVLIQEDERIAQGIFIPFLIADNGNTDTERKGGIGSTN